MGNVAVVTLAVSVFGFYKVVENKQEYYKAYLEQYTEDITNSVIDTIGFNRDLEELEEEFIETNVWGIPSNELIADCEDWCYSTISQVNDTMALVNDMISTCEEAKQWTRDEETIAYLDENIEAGFLVMEEGQGLIDACNDMLVTLDALIGN